MIRKVLNISHNFFNALFFLLFLLNSSAVMREGGVPKGRGVKPFIIVCTCVIWVVGERVNINIHSIFYFLGKVCVLLFTFSWLWHCLPTLVQVRGCYNNWLWTVIATIKVLTSLNTNTTKPQHCRSRQEKYWNSIRSSFVNPQWKIKVGEKELKEWGKVKTSFTSTNAMSSSDWDLTFTWHLPSSDLNRHLN